MRNCEVCLNEFNSAIEPRITCRIRGCKKWNHAGCALVTQCLGQNWYCEIHWQELSKLIEEGKSVTDIEEVMAKSQQQSSIENNKNDNNVSIGESSNILCNSRTQNNVNDNNETTSDEINSDENSNDPNSHLDLNSHESLVPYDNGNDYNPFSNFLCEVCSESFSRHNKGVLCIDCRSVFHIKCLNDSELKEVSKCKFCCKDCIANRVRLESLKQSQRQQMKQTESRSQGRSFIAHGKSRDLITIENSLATHNLPCSTKLNKVASKNISQKHKKKSKKILKRESSSDDSDNSDSSSSSSDSDKSYRKKKSLKHRFSSSSPITSQYIKNEITKGYEEEYPDAVKTIRDLTYVDDVVTSVNDFECGKRLIYDVRSILNTGGFNLVKLKSNEPKILEKIRFNLNPEELTNEKLFSNEVSEKLLGYIIDFESDTISIALTLEKIPDEILNCESKPTKKQILQVCMSIYDPVGYFEFLLSKFKLIYHFVIKDNYEWTQLLDDKYFPMWKKYMRLLNEIKEIKIPRWYSPQILDAKIIQLVGFSDASTDILCNIIYIRLLDENRNQLDYRFVCAKSYIVPLKQIRTIPDLELDAADKLVTLMNKVVKQHIITFNELIYCIDSSAVKDWIINDAKNPKIYVKRRLLRIRSSTKPKQWRWVPTDYQPADFGTKITSIPGINYYNEWYHPKLFCLPEENWPQIETNKVSVNFHLANNQFNLKEDKVVEYENYSTLERLFHLVRLCFKYKYLAHIKSIKKQIELLLEANTDRTRNQIKKNKAEIRKHECQIEDSFVEMNKKDLKHTQIELALIKMAQKESYTNEYECLLKGSPLKKSNPLNKLLIYLDDDGLMRAKSRIADNPENRKKFGLDRISPIILPRNNHLIKLIILHYHHAQAHHNEKTVVVNLLQRFHILKIKRTVNKVIRSCCMKCKIANAKPQTPLMGDLPNNQQRRGNRRY